VQYTGKKLKSFTSEVKIIGQLNLDKCSFNQTDNLNDVKIVVTEDQESMNGCIIGTDLMKQIPEFDSAMQQLEETIKNMSQNVIKRYEIIRNKQNIEMIRTIVEDNKLVYAKVYHIMEEVKEVKYNQVDNDEEIDIIRNHVEQRLKQSAAQSLKKIRTNRESNVQFKIELLNPNQRPLEARARPLPYHIKDKVKQAIKEQEEAGIIRKSKSDWTSALRVVDKSDGDIRLTVDYKPLNKVIKSDNYPLPNISEI
jgi:hypothetical protein